jgi:hypothetical protein
MWQFEMKYTLLLLYLHAGISWGIPQGWTQSKYGSVAPAEFLRLFPHLAPGQEPTFSFVQTSSKSLFLWASASAGQRNQEVEGPEPVLRHWSIGVGSVGAMPSILQIVLQLSNYMCMMDCMGFRFGFEVHRYARICCGLRSNQTWFVPPLSCVRESCMRSSGIWHVSRYCAAAFATACCCPGPYLETSAPLGPRR